MISESRATEPRAESRAQRLAADVLTTVNAATRAMEAESAAIVELERAYQEANDAAARLRSSVKAEAAARVETAKAQNRTKKPLGEENKAARAAAKATRKQEIKAAILKAKQDKLAKDQTTGRERDLGAVDKAKSRAEDARREAEAAHLALGNAKDTSEAARVEVRSAQEKSKLAAARVLEARIDDARAKENVEGAEVNAKKTVESSKGALLTEAVAKKALDRAIRALKPIMLREARVADAAASRGQRASTPQEDQPHAANQGAKPVEKLKALKSRVTRVGGRLPGIRRAPQDLPEIAAISKNQIAQVDSATQLAPNMCAGIVRLFIFDPADRADITELQDRLRQLEGVRITSTAGSATKGTCITVAAAQPVALSSHLEGLDIVRRVLKIGKDFEVKLRLPDSHLEASENTISSSSSVR